MIYLEFKENYTFKKFSYMFWNWIKKPNLFYIIHNHLENIFLVKKIIIKKQKDNTTKELQYMS